MDTPKKKILVVEDDNDSRNALCAMLDVLGFGYIGFASGKEALQAIKSHKIDMALLDIMMPEMNGYEVMQALKAIPECKDIPIIMVTAKDQDSDVLMGYQTGADYYITKPFTVKQLDYGIRIFLS